jgi:hypothetical protein
MRMSRPGPRGQSNTARGGGGWSGGRRGRLPDAAGPVELRPRGMPLSYTQFVADVGAGTVRAVTIGPAGQVTGSLAGGQPFTTTIPVALGGNGLAGDLAATTSRSPPPPPARLAELGAARPAAAVADRRPALRRRPARPPAGRQHGRARRPGRGSPADQGEGASHRRRAAGHPVRRRGRLPRGEDGDRRVSAGRVPHAGAFKAAAPGGLCSGACRGAAPPGRRGPGRPRHRAGRYPRTAATVPGTACAPGRWRRR